MHLQSFIFPNAAASAIFQGTAARSHPLRRVVLYVIIATKAAIVQPPVLPALCTGRFPGREMTAVNPMNPMCVGQRVGRGVRRGAADARGSRDGNE